MNTNTEYQIGEYKIQTINSGPPWKENCYLVVHIPTNEQLVIDPGANAKGIIERIQENGGPLNQIWLTHAHHDHVGAALELSQYYGISCQLHKADERLLRHSPMYALRFGGIHIEPPEKVEYYQTPCSLTFGKQDISIIHTPGHSSGSVCFPFNGFMFTGDTLVFEHMGRTDLPGGDGTLILQSITMCLEKIPESTVLFGGHGKPWTAGEAKEWWSLVQNNPPKLNLFDKTDGDNQ